MVTVITKTIGSGKDYATFALAEADVTNIGTSADLVANDEAIVFEAYAGTYTGGFQINSSLVTDPTRNVTYTVAAGSDHGGDPRYGVIIETSSGISDSGIWVYDSHTIFDGLVLKTTVGSDSKGWRFQDVNSVATVIRNCIYIGSASGTVASSAIYALSHGYSAIPTVVENCRLSGQVYLQTTSADGNWRFMNNTLIADPAQPSKEFRGIAANLAVRTTLTINVTNNWGDCFRSFYTTGSGTAVVTGSNNYGKGTGIYDFPAAIRGTPYPITASQSYDPGAGDYALYVGKNGALLDSPNNDVIGGGVGPSVNSDVPIVDILGNARSGSTANPGAFEIPQATLIRTRTIGPVGRDYASFTLAEADVENIPTSTDMVNENEAIVFEADAGTYDETVTFSSSLTTDATRQVTYKPAAGSGHNGSVLEGVRFVRDGAGEDGPKIYDDFTIFDGIVSREELLAQNRSCFQILGQNITLRNCLSRNGDGITATVGSGLTMVGNHDGARVENCVAIGAYQGFKSFASASLGTIASTIVNCTHAPPTTNSFGYFAPGSGTTLNLTLINNLNIGGASAGDYRTAGSGTVNASGSNNFGGSTNPFPVAIQGSPYPVTATTDTDPGPGDWAIYDAATGALIDDPDNDVIGGGVGPFVNSDVPETDILGNPRLGSTTEPGAFVISSSVAPLPPVNQWTQVMVRSDEPVDVHGVLTFGDAYINAVETTLSATGTGISANTAAIPVGTRAIWVQLISQTGPSAGETADIAIEISASQSLTMVTVGSGVGTGYVPGLYQFPVQCLSLDDAEAYPRVKMTNGATVGATDIVKVRVIAIGGTHTDTAWT